MKGNSSHVGEPALELPATSSAGVSPSKENADSISSQLIRSAKRLANEAKWYREKPRLCCLDRDNLDRKDEVFIYVES